MKTITIDELLNDLTDAENIDFSQQILKGCMAIENSAKLKCPVDTGELRRSITSQLIDDKTGIVGSDLEYAKYVEYGTGIWESHGIGRQDKWTYQDFDGTWHTTIGQPPQPFMEPAFIENKEYIKDLLVNKIKEEMTK